MSKESYEAEFNARAVQIGQQLKVKYMALQTEAQQADDRLQREGAALMRKHGVTGVAPQATITGWNEPKLNYNSGFGMGYGYFYMARSN